jgi:uncharacterized protein (DUF983 family)
MDAGRIPAKLTLIKLSPVHMTMFSRPTWTEALMRGLKRACPRCGQGKMFAGYLTPRESCEVCGLAFEPLRADDAPAYFTVFLVGHIVIAGVLFTEQLGHPPMWVQFLWLPVAVVMTGVLLPLIKGGVMGAIYSSQANEHRSPAE